MKRLPVRMIRKDGTDIPQFPLPEGFSIRFFRAGDERHWARIEKSVDEFASEEAALERFNQEFGPCLDDMAERCLFIENESGEPVATTTAWYGKLPGEEDAAGRIHWVGVMPEYQGKKLSKPLLSAAMNILAERHSQMYLTSQTTSYKAINMYLNYGFEPDFSTEDSEEAWGLIGNVLGRRILEGG